MAPESRRAILDAIGPYARHSLVIQTAASGSQISIHCCTRPLTGGGLRQPWSLMSSGLTHSSDVSNSEKTYDAEL